MREEGRAAFPGPQSPRKPKKTDTLLRCPQAPASKGARKLESAPRRQSQRIKALVNKVSSTTAAALGACGSRSQKQPAGAAGSKHSGHLKMAAAVGKRALSTHHASAKGSSARLTRVLQTRKVMICH